MTNANETAENTSEVTDVLDVLEAMPHGSGWDMDARIKREYKNGNYKLESGYHCMDENGYYDGWITVYTTVNLSTKKVVRITYEAIPYRRRKYITGQSDYYASCIYGALERLGFE